MACRVDIHTQRLLWIIGTIKAQRGSHLRDTLMLRVQVRFGRHTQVQMELLGHVWARPRGVVQRLGVLERNAR